MVHERLGGDVSIYGFGVTELVDPCVLDGVNDEIAALAFGGFMELEIVPPRLLDGPGYIAEKISGVVKDS